MIRGYANKRIDCLAWEIALVDDVRNFAFTFELTAHSLKDVPRHATVPTSRISFEGEFMEAFKGLAEAMIQMGFLNESATTSELKATKYHLEDMRKLGLKNA